jgi:hypothetical protein
VRRAIVPAILLFASSSPALAADNGIYLGASVGQINLKVDDLGGLSAADFDGEDTAFKVIAGIRPLDWLAVEAAYVDFGHPDDYVLGEEFEAEGYGVSAFGVGFLAVGPVDLFGKLGLITWDTNFRGGLENDGTDFAYGVGAQFRVWSISLRAEYEVFDLSEVDDLSMISVGVTYTFL